MEKNVIVTDENGKIIGSTYLRRAKGLVKNDRAVWADDNLQQTVILTCPPDIVEEDNIMENTENAVNFDLFFNAKEWSFNQKCENNKGERCFIEDSDGELTEIYCIGNWHWDWTSIISKPYALQKNTRYTFTFWLNGGENDCNEETCQLRIMFDEDDANVNIYKLNRSYIKPKKHVDGWYLFEIPFTTGDNDITRLEFVAMRAPMAVKSAKALRDYAELQSTPIPEGKPQRHNIVFENGWPADKPYGFREFTNVYNGNNRQSFDGFSNFSNSSNFGGFDSFADTIKEKIMDEIDVDSIADEVAEQIRADLKNTAE